MAKNAAGLKQADHMRNSFFRIQIPINCPQEAELICMPQMPNLINLAIPGFIALLLLEVVLDAVMRRDLYQFKDTATSLAMGTGNVLLGVVSKPLVFAAYTAVHRFAIFNIGYQWWAWAILFFAEDLTYYWFHRCAKPGRAVSCHSSSGCGCLWSAFNQ
jgi:hypothetical protein